jgi:hypothetical protein
LRQCARAAVALGCMRLHRGHFVGVGGRPPSAPFVREVCGSRDIVIEKVVLDILPPGAKRLDKGFRWAHPFAQAGRVQVREFLWMSRRETNRAAWLDVYQMDGGVKPKLFANLFVAHIPNLADNSFRVRL